MKASMKREDMCNYAFLLNIHNKNFPRFLFVFLFTNLFIFGRVVSPRVVRCLLLKPQTGLICSFLMRYSTVD